MSSWTSIRDSTIGIVATVAPGLATALGGPLAGQAVAALSQTLLGHPKGSHEEVEQAIIGATPDQLLAIKNADHDFTLKMKSAGVDLKKIAAADRDSARTNNKDSNIPAILTIAILTVFGAEAYVVFAGHAEGLKDTTIAVISTLVIRETLHFVRQALTYWLGDVDDPEAPDNGG